MFRLEAVKEKREGSDEDEDDSSGKRVFGPRKRFRWNEEIRCDARLRLNVKMILNAELLMCGDVSPPGSWCVM